MGKVSIVYWSGTGNTEAMAAAMAEGAKDAGAEVELLTVDKADAAALSEAKAFALGCPAMGAEVLEEGEMEPFMAELDSQIAKSARPSVLDRLKASPVHGAPEKPHKKEMEAR